MSEPDDGLPTMDVTLARDLHVGPKGGLRKAGETVTLLAVDARLLLKQGDARLTADNPATTVVQETPNDQETE